jgi:prefoldin subunit 1
MSNQPPQPDPELKKAFEDLQVKMVSNRSQMKLIGIQSDQFKRQIQHSKLTEKEVGQLDESIRMYEGIGRMFILCDKKRIMDNLDEKMKSYESKITSLDKTREYLEKSLKDSENSLREMITAKKQQS